ncbi:PEP-CTERM sorting domain-containing protein [Pleionea sp. CnH1-48]|uniref:PEP-CTERM sorting domain-containing protein n=1 Tax=Pleionea sp. CnH1-48 TaxID=2954494 RepID=UPI00209765FD|nr:PEP-CTERM sorting domain-containing protein [Pleionea sp. CnH1-48]MCO7225876.1 PEP-CTERM sorting domain-containing protein [Pleionea sp. CnH1-48]
MIKNLKKLLAISAIAFASISSHATIVSFDLADHPDGNQALPTYGLRLDGLFGSGSSTEWTFTFDNMRMDVDTTLGTAHIYGTLHGGIDTGPTRPTEYDWYVDFLYSDNIIVNPDGSWSVSDSGGDNTANWGLLTLLSDVDLNGDNLSDMNSSIGLVEHMGGRLDDDSHRCNGHAGCGPWVGIGWLSATMDFVQSNDSSNWNLTHHNAMDWLYQATPVPEPGSLFILLSGIAGLAAYRKRR